MLKMPEVPECLERRYRALDSLIEELSARRSARNSDASCSRRTDNTGIKLMCDFWNILKDDPDCNLKKEVQQRMCINVPSTHSSFGPHHVTCYMADRMSANDKSSDDKAKSSSSKNPIEPPKSPKREPSNTASKGGCCNSAKNIKMSNDPLPLSKVLCSLKDAASFDKKCGDRITDLIEAQKRLQDQIHTLEHREKEGAKLLKQADCMWSSMEEAYKKKVAESLERQKALLKALKEAEADVAKWRKNKKELEFQVDNVNKCKQEIFETINRKKNDIKTMKTEIDDFKKRVENGKKDVDSASKSLGSRKQASDKVIEGINKEIVKMQKKLEEEKRHKSQKEKEGNQYIKEAREELQKLCRVLLQKKLENEDQKAEKEALLLEIEMLKQTCDQCKDKCKNKQISINDEILKVEQEIANYKVRCVRCHQCVDTSDIRRYCTDCPRCLEERECINDGGQCTEDPANVCVCMSIKQKFMDNVFENMYTVLEKQVKTCQGKCLAETVMQSLKNSRNGKIDDETKKVLQEFILSVVKKNLNLTIIGGAVKTRCEMDPETYKQLMLCMKQVKVSRPPKVDKGTVAKKDPCSRWGGVTECNCPGGAKSCICCKKAPPPPHDPKPCPEDPEDKQENEKQEKLICPHKDKTPCGTECGARGMDSLVGTEIAPWVPDPCKEKSCPFSKNMRAAQCMLGPEILSELGTIKPIPNLDIQTKSFRNDVANHPRDRIIEEVMGRYTELLPIEKVAFDEVNVKTIDMERRKVKRGKIRNRHSRASKDIIKNKKPQGFTCYQVNVQNDKFYGLQVSPKIYTIYVSNKKCDEFWSSDNMFRSCDDFVNVSNNVDYAFISNEVAIKPEQNISLNKSDISRDVDEYVTKTDNSDLKLFGKVTRKDVKKIVKDIMQIDVRAKDKNYSPSVEFVTVKSLIKLLASRNTQNGNGKTKQNKAAVKKNKMEASTITDKKVGKIVEPKRQVLTKDVGANIVLEKGKRKRETDDLLRNLYDDEPSSAANCTRYPSNALANMKLLISDDNGDIVDYCTELVMTASDELGIELDENFFHLIERKAAKDPNCIAGALLTDEAGLFTLDFNPKFIPNDDLKVKVKKTSSGSMSIILNKKFIASLKSHNNKSNIYKAMDKSASIEVKKRSNFSTPSNNSNKTNVSNLKNEAWNRLVNFCVDGINCITLKIIGNNKDFKYVKAKLLRTPSRNIALEVDNIEIITDNLKNMMDDFGLLHLSNSDTFLLDFSQSSHNIPRNTLIRKDSDKILLTVRDQLLVANQDRENSKSDYFKIKVKDNNDVIIPPVVLKLTQSENYEVIVDKEFERNYKETMNRFCENDTIGSGVLLKTTSSEYLISLNNKNEKDCNVFILKSTSSIMKLVVRGPTFDSIKNSCFVNEQKSSICSSSLITFLKRYQKGRHIFDENYSKIPKLRSHSESSLFDKSKLLHQSSFKESGSLKRTSSGRYSVVLDKESKKTFVNNLGNYLKKNSNSLIPIKRTKSGGINIVLNNQDNSNGQNGALKISPSGNVYVIIDKEQDVKKEDIATKMSADISSKIIQEVQNPLNKSVTTNCNANPLDCCNFSKCVCEELKTANSDWFVPNLENLNNNDNQDVLKQEAPLPCNKNNCPRKVGFSFKKEERCTNNSSPHIIIKPSDNNDVRSKALQKTIDEIKGKSEQCFYVLDSVCPYHIDRYDNVSNELIEISGLCNKGMDELSSLSQELSNTKSWTTAKDDSVKSNDLDYLDNIPPQLPPFLRNFTIS